MDFLRFSNDFFNFKMVMSIKCYKYSLEKKQKFFFNFTVFDEYCSQIKNKIEHGIIKLDCKLNNVDVPVGVCNECLEIMHQKTFSLIEKLYNRQRSYSSNPVINSRIHAVVSFYPNFGFYYDLLKNELKLLIEELYPSVENNYHLVIDKGKTSQKDWAQFFGNNMEYVKWEPIAELFQWTTKSLKSSFYIANQENNKKKKIADMISEYYRNLP